MANDADLELCNLSVKVACAQALSELLQAIHLCCDATSAVIPAPSSSDGSTVTVVCAHDLVAGDVPGGVGFQWFGVLAWRYNRGSAARGDCILATKGVECAVGSDGGHILLSRDLVEQFGQHGA